MKKQSINNEITINVDEVKKFFELAIKEKLLDFSEDCGGWQSVYYRENLGATREDGTKWRHLCSQSLKEYETELELINRITLMLAETCRSLRQDCNILMRGK